MDAIHIIDIIKNGGIFAPLVVVTLLLIKQNDKKDDVIKELSIRILAIVEAAKQVVESASKK